jgi:hypothetical protein
MREEPRCGASGRGGHAQPGVVRTGGGCRRAIGEDVRRASRQAIRRPQRATGLCEIRRCIEYREKRGADKDRLPRTRVHQRTRGRLRGASSGCFQRGAFPRVQPREMSPCGMSGMVGAINGERMTGEPVMTGEWGRRWSWGTGGGFYSACPGRFLRDHPGRVSSRLLPHWRPSPENRALCRRASRGRVAGSRTRFPFR